LQCSAQCFAGASGDGLTGMCEWGRIFNAGFAVFCAVFRRGERGCGERGWASGDVLAGTVFDAGFAVFCAGFRRGERVCGERGFASRDVASGGVRAGTVFFKIVGLRKNKEVTLW
jgi:hypothetical protein